MTHAPLSQKHKIQKAVKEMFGENSDDETFTVESPKAKEEDAKRPDIADDDDDEDDLYSPDKISLDLANRTSSGQRNQASHGPTLKRTDKQFLF